MTTIEGGMISLNESEMYNHMRMLRSHGLLRESADENYKNQFIERHPELNEGFIFPVAGFNFRSTELNAVLGLNQIQRLDENIEKHAKSILTQLVLE